MLDNTIDSVKEFIAFANAVNAGKSYAGETVTLGADLDLAGVTWTPIGTSASPFSGTFDGNGKVIKNLTIDGTAKVGLFGVLDGAVVKNLTFVGAEISATGGSGGGGSSEAIGITIADAGGYFETSSVEGALQELGASLIGLADAVNYQSGVIE